MRISVSPIKDNSVRLPGKNHRPFCGVPLVIHKMRQLVPVFDRVFLVADPAYLAMPDVMSAMPADVEIIERPAWTLAEYESNIRDRFRWIFNHLIRDMGVPNTAPACWAHVTNPLVSSESYDNAIGMWEDCPWMQNGTVVGCRRVRGHFWKPVRGGMEPDNHRPGDPHQYARDTRPYLEQDGSLFIQKARDFADNGEFIHGKAFPYVLPDRECADIDTEADWLVAEALWQASSPEEK